ncbi:MAG TPA: sulfite exporter TauE/SafE family protein [Candidatus Nitrosocosmicus sp.]|nr:sulfite exporter TauE/SafE family protein [Candidatus Nitrosocosmicus sp.]
MFTEFIIGFFLSVIAGLIGSMIGIGGGIIISPFLSYIDYLPSQISSTSLISVFSTSLSSSIVFIRKKLISNKVGLILSIFSIPGTYFGVLLSKMFSLSEFKFYFAFILLGTSLYLVLKSRFKKKNNLLNSAYTFENHSNLKNFYFRLSLIIFFSFFAGILSSSFGIGGGIIYVPSLIIFLEFNMNQAAATSQFALLFTSFSGLLFYIYYGYPNYGMGFILSIGSLLGGLAGSKLSSKVSSNSLQKIFSIILIIVSIKLFYDGV